MNYFFVIASFAKQNEAIQKLQNSKHLSALLDCSASLRFARNLRLHRIASLVLPRKQAKRCHAVAGFCENDEVVSILIILLIATTATPSRNDKSNLHNFLVGKDAHPTIKLRFTLRNNSMQIKIFKTK
ncbi:MAG: hypothetical protein J6T36_01260 [Campylobacter sp.]|nr:hypothetical protein [Campylobacter sp.]